MPETRLYNDYLVSVAPPQPNAVEDGAVYSRSPLANGTPWIPSHKTLVVSLRQHNPIKPVVCAAFLSVLAVVAVVLIFNALFSQPNRNQTSNMQFPESNFPVTTEGVQPLQCGTRPAFSAKRRKRIVNGVLSSDGQWPWQVAVEYRGRYRCGGVVITTDWVMTAAHCMYLEHGWQRLNASEFTVHAGSTVRNHTVKNNANVQIATVRTFYIHPRYLAERRIDNYDIAMLRLARPLEWGSGYVMPACLPEQGMKFTPEDECYLASWGSIKPQLFLRAEQTHIAMPLLSREDCYAFASTISPRHTLQINEQKLCAGILPTVSGHRAGACKFDSGSGLVCLNSNAELGKEGSWYIVGLVSGGKKCGEVNYYTNVTTMMSFIQPLVNGHLPPQLFSCDKGQRSIWSDQVCDGHFDCDDQSDEQQCECAETQFRCDNGLCKMDYYCHCNGQDDCGDGSDERNCSYFDCGDGKQIAPQMMCDGEIDCDTLRDETNCECSPSQFRCDNSICVPGFWRCDGIDDCLDASDELNCNCTADQMDCGNSRCVPHNRMCDLTDDCGNFRDEANCTCVSDHFPCESLGICLHTDLLWTCQLIMYDDTSDDSSQIASEGSSADEGAP
ncbi:uncharacterized protein LOC110985743 isoform X5 [Acanthaster planci]|uniref:Uncharacterized protein LOC110985743 isoform X5 n=1 Tax=Acanthaster planci TaxID=133434 RepID=A0A8B7ZAH6_ACAPL|nr:uncharacterized protein LOC110985743 isoform X5 [Acanthaster planci]